MTLKFNSWSVAAKVNIFSARNLWWSHLGHRSLPLHYFFTFYRPLYFHPKFSIPPILVTVEAQIWKITIFFISRNIGDIKRCKFQGRSGPPRPPPLPSKSAHAGLWWLWFYSTQPLVYPTDPDPHFSWLEYCRYGVILKTKTTKLKPSY